MRISIKLKMSLVLVVLLILTVSVLSVLVLRGIKVDQQRRVEAQLAKQAEIAEQYIQQSLVTGDVQLPIDEFMAQKGQRLALYIARLTDMRVTLYDANGKEAGSSLPVEGENEKLTDTLQYALDGKIAYQTSGDSLVYFSPIRGDEGLMGVVQLHYSLQDNLEFVQTIRQLFVNAGLIVLAVGFVLGYGYFARLASVISRLRSASHHIRQGEYLDKPPVTRRDELGELSRDIYYMSSSIEKHIGEMQEEQHKLELAIGKLQQLEKQQKQFIGNISHEFKTPLTSIRAYVDLLGMYKDDPKLMDEAVGSIGKETERLYEMVDKVLRLSALEKYEFENQAEAVELRELLLDLCARMSGKAAKFGLVLDTKLEPAVVWADQESLMHIFVNLIDNAIKYNVPGGSIVVSSAIADGHVTISVLDTGIGIPKEARDKIFEPFYTVNKDRARISGGTGLGLSLVQQLIEAQGGKLQLIHRSDVEGEQGTVVCVTLPLHRS